MPREHTSVGKFETARREHNNWRYPGWAAMFVPLALFACSSQGAGDRPRSGDVEVQAPGGLSSVAQAAEFFVGPINGRLPDGSLASPFDGINSLEIDDRDNNPGTAGTAGQLNANYNTTGAHDAVPHAFLNCGSNSDIDQDCPDTAVDAYGDWDDIGPTVEDLTPGVHGNHKIVDGIANTDPTIFSPDSCVTNGSVLGKQDITETWAGNNDQYFYFGQARRENNGNSQFYWLFTQVAPRVVNVANNCTQQLQYQFTPGDVRVRIGFPSAPNSSQPLVSDLSYHKFTGTATGTWLPAADAVNDVLLNPANWTDTTATAVKNYALNTTPIAKPTSGTNSSLVTKAPDTGKVDLVEFAEGAIDLGQLISGGICGKVLYISVITRPSESATSDLKDLLGPIEYSFGGVTAAAELAPTCSLQIDKTGTAVDESSTPITEDSAFDWTFYKCVDGCDTMNDDGTLTAVGGADTQEGTEPDDAIGTFTVGSAGSYFAVLKVTDPSSPSCFDYAASNSVTLYTPISVNPVMTGSCDATGSWTFNAQPNTSATCSWTFTDTNTTRDHSPTSSSDVSGNGTTTRGNGAPDTINGSVTCTQTRATDDLTCQASGTASANVYAPILVDIAPDNTSLTCTVPGTPGSDNGNIGPGVTFTATATGGAGTLTYDWTVTGPNAATCTDGAGNTTCVVDIPDSNFCALTQVYVTVDDGNSCAAATSETETVTKLTQVSASNTP